MTTEQWFIFFLAANVIHFMLFWKLYVKAGHSAWSAAIPFYNVFVMTKIINRPWYWGVLFFIPGINLMMMLVYQFQLAEVFGLKPRERWITVFTFGLYLAYKAYFEFNRLEYKPEHDDKETLIGSIMFAVIAATLVHSYMFQPFTIPTGSLEKSLLIGDYLFVSKLHYGPRVPMTTIQVPMLHDTIPVLKIRSYLKRPQLPYMRLPGFQKVKRNDIVVFNWPADTVRQFFKEEAGVRKPFEKKSNYVKRCVGLPGDTIQIKNGILYVNGKRATYPDRTHLQHLYKVYTKKGVSLSVGELRRLDKRYDVYEIARPSKDYYIMNLTDEAKKAVEQFPEVEKTEMYLDTIKSAKVFPGDKRWSRDNFGPVYIPKKGDKIKLTEENYPIYKKLLTEYETMEPLSYNQVEMKNGTVYINGKPVKEYTFKQNYYWMMGDNRSNSEDSRVWGFVPWTHITGKPVFIWFSYDKRHGKIRWDRLFTTVSGKGKRVSYLWPFLLLVALYYAYSYYRKKKKPAKK